MLEIVEMKARLQEADAWVAFRVHLEEGAPVQECREWIRVVDAVKRGNAGREETTSLVLVNTPQGHVAEGQTTWNTRSETTRTAPTRVLDVQEEDTTTCPGPLGWRQD